MVHIHSSVASNPVSSNSFSEVGGLSSDHNGEHHPAEAGSDDLKEKEREIEQETEDYIDQNSIELTMDQTPLSDTAIHWIILIEFLALLLDTMTAPFFIISFLTPWRHGIFWRAFRDPKRYPSDMSRRLLCLQQAFMSIFDVPCAAMLVVVMLSLWRAFPLMHQIKAFANSGKKKKSDPDTDTDAEQNEQSQSVDVLKTPEIPEVIDEKNSNVESGGGSGYGYNGGDQGGFSVSNGLTSQKSSEEPNNPTSHGHDEPPPYTPSVIAAARLEDQNDTSPASCCGIVPYSVWEKTFGFSVKLHVLICLNFFTVLIELPLVVMTYVCLLTWRHYPVRALLTREHLGFSDWNQGKQGRNLALCFHFLLLVLDLPIFILFCMLMFTWRNMGLVKLMRSLDIAPTVSSDQPAAPSISLSPEANPTNNSNSPDSDSQSQDLKNHDEQVIVTVTELSLPKVEVPAGRYHETVLRTFGAFLLDLPFILPFLVVWRVPLLIRVLKLPRHAVAPGGG